MTGSGVWMTGIGVGVAGGVMGGVGNVVLVNDTGTGVAGVVMSMNDG